VTTPTAKANLASQQKFKTKNKRRHANGAVLILVDSYKTEPNFNFHHSLKTSGVCHSERSEESAF
jgi:hypothetical protein